MAIEILDLILIALFTGIGNAIGQPIGRWIWQKILRHNGKKLAEQLTSLTAA